MSVPAAWPQVLTFFGTPLVIEPSAGQLAKWPCVALGTATGYPPAPRDAADHLAN